ncbi:hypothetical protein [Granulicella paludicola]|uniref:hypothetical protein n=1 Tax=Granulicella paludicola TaxID=474951 RepID=UPI0021DFB028|nr:hypothetical protein [Granulicella paludicola]
MTWPLFVSLLLTAAVVAFVCAPPMTPVHSWEPIFTLATVYLMVAGSVHAAAVWGVCRVRDESRGAGVWPVVWTAWVAIVWLPLIALLTQERSPWVAAVLPVTAVFATVLLRKKDALNEESGGSAVRMFENEMPLWEIPRAAVVASVGLQIGITMLATSHAWTAGCLLAAAVIYPVDRWLERTNVVEGAISRWQRVSAANSAVVWLLMVLALVPFIAAYASGEMSTLLGLHPVSHSAQPRASAAGAAGGFTGIILTTPKRPYEVVVPMALIAGGAGIRDPHKIAFDGAYWFFKRPYTQPTANVRRAQGDPIRNHIFSTDNEPLMMEAHQHLDTPISMSCCRSLRVEVDNADNVRGSIALEVLVRNSAEKHGGAISLGDEVLPTSVASPMPLKRGTVPDHVTFQLPRAVMKGRTFDEITVRIRTAESQGLSGVKVAVKDFVLVP